MNGNALAPETVEDEYGASITKPEDALTDWAKEPSVALLKQDLESAKSSHNAAIAKINHWRDILEVQGSAKPKEFPNRSKIQPKLVRRQNEWRYSALSEPFLGTDKLFEVRPATFEDADSARQNELLLNHQFRTYLDRVRFIDEYVRATTDEGTSILRVGWVRETRQEKVDAPVYEMREPSPEDLQKFQQFLAMEAEDPNGFAKQAHPDLVATVDYFKESGELKVHTQTGVQQVEVEKVVRNHPTLELVDPRNVFLDPSAGGDQTKAKFLVYSFETSRADLKASGIQYQNLDKVLWGNNGPIDTTEHTPVTTDPTAQFSDKARQRIVAYEYWGFFDIAGNGELTPIVATWIGNVLIRLEKNPFPDGKIPFIFVNYLPKKRSVYGEADAEFLEDNQAVIGAAYRGIIDMLGRSANGQQGFAKGMLDPVNRARLDRGDDYEFNPSIHPQNGIVEHKFPEIPQSALLLLQQQNQEAESMTGVKSFHGGVSGDAYGPVAAGIRGMLDAASKREMAILRRLAGGLVEAAKRWISMNAVFLSEEEVVRTTNAEFVRVRRDELEGKFDLITDISTAEVDETKSQDLSFLLQTLGPVADINMVKMILAEITRLKRMPELSEAIRRFEPKPDPLEEKKKELEIAKLQAEIEEIQAKAAAARSKAAYTEAQADTEALAMVERADGIQHERDMEKVAAQAESQSTAQIVKALANPRKEGERPGAIDAAVGFHEASKRQPLSSTPIVDTTLGRDALALQDPTMSLGSKYFDPNLDPALNQGLNL